MTDLETLEKALAECERQAPTPTTIVVRARSRREAMALILRLADEPRTKATQ